jgi:cleavage stimulation factor subunit 3
LLAEWSPKYKAAWNTYKEKKAIRDGLLPNMLARPPRGGLKESQQKWIWQQLAEFEQKNIQRLSSQEVRAKVVFTYNQALLCLYHHPEVW